MASKVDIWNLALTDVGGDFIIDPLDNSVQANLCKLHYPASLEFVLESVDWNFAIKRAEVAVSGSESPVYGFSNSFKIPSDCLRVIEVWDRKDGEQNQRFETNNLQWQQEGDYISANTSSQVYIRYISKVEDTTRFSSSFVNAVSKYLAYRLAIPVAANRQLKSDLLGEYNMILREAAANNGLTGRTKAIRSNVLIGSRLR